MNKDTCKGLILRYTENFFIAGDGSIKLNRTFRPLKRKSCDGSCIRSGDGLCDTAWMLEHLKDEIPYSAFDFPTGAVSGSLFRLCAVTTESPYEYLDEVEVEFYLKRYEEGY